MLQIVCFLLVIAAATVTLKELCRFLFLQF